jgi:Transposase IS116/IS110/IS902 family
MKTRKLLPYAVHRTFDKSADGKRTLTFYVFNGKKVVCLNEVKLNEWLRTLPANSPVRFTAVSSSDQVLATMVEGTTVRIMHANWHALEVEKNLEPEVIVQKVAEASDEPFTEFKIDPKIGHLRAVLNTYNAVNQLFGDCLRKFKQVARDGGDVSYESLEDALSKVSFIDDNKGGKSRSEVTKVEAELKKTAKDMWQCRLFNSVAGIKDGWVTAATVVAYSGGIERFPTVASFWHYCGVHVVNGKMPMPKSGQTVTWSPRLRKALFVMTDSMCIKNGKRNPWGKVFQEFTSQEMRVHASKCQCKNPEYHSKKRARWRVAKEILKRYYVAASGQEFKSSEAVFVKHKTNAALGASVGA